MGSLSFHQILRQYALLASLIQKIFNAPDASNDRTKDKERESKGGPHRASKAGVRNDKGLIVLSNDDANEEKLDYLLTGGRRSSEVKDMGSDIKVDVTLRTPLGQAPVIMVLFAAKDDAPDHGTTDPEPAWFDVVSVSIEIGLNGRISIVDTTGLGEDVASADGGSSEGEGEGEGEGESDEARKQEGPELRRRMVRVLEISQDLGILVEWMLRWLRQRERRR